jgi:uncharacterized membrane protein
LKNFQRRNMIGFLLGIPFVLIGTQHFIQPDLFNAIVPAYLGWPSFWNYTSGALEILLGLGIMIPPSRKHSARLLVLLVLLMSQANVNMWVNDLPFNGTRMSTSGHILRLIIQLLLLTVLLWLGEGIGETNNDK